MYSIHLLPQGSKNEDRVWWHLEIAKDHRSVADVIQAEMSTNKVIYWRFLHIKFNYVHQLLLSSLTDISSDAKLATSIDAPITIFLNDSYFQFSFF